MELEKKLIRLIEDPSEENRNLGYGMILSKLSKENVLFWYYTIHQIKTRIFHRHTTLEREVYSEIFRITANIADSIGLDIDTANTDDNAAIEFARVHFDIVSPKSIDILLKSITMKVMKRISKNADNETLTNKIKQIDILNGYTK